MASGFVNQKVAGGQHNAEAEQAGNQTSSQLFMYCLLKAV